MLLLRLKEELIDASEVCSVGILNRLINIIQGFTSDTELQIVAEWRVALKLQKSYQKKNYMDMKRHIVDL